MANAAVDTNQLRDMSRSNQPYRAFDDPVEDKLLGLILALGAEVWVLKDRNALLEAAIERRGIELAALIEECAQDPDRVPVMEQERSAFFRRFLQVLDSTDLRSL